MPIKVLKSSVIIIRSCADAGRPIIGFGIFIWRERIGSSENEKFQVVIELLADRIGELNDFFVFKLPADELKDWRRNVVEGRWL